jgi:hypothetical protein
MPLTPNTKFPASYEALLELASEQGTRAELTGDIQAIYRVWRF